MRREHWVDLGPSLLLGLGIVVATLVARLASESGWLVLAGPLLLALAVVSADVLGSRRRGEPSGPSSAAWIMGGAILLAGAIVAPRDPRGVMTLIPLVGMASWVTLLRRSDRPRKARRGI